MEERENGQRRENLEEKIEDGKLRLHMGK